MAGEDDVRDGAAEPGSPGPAPIIDLGDDAVPVRPVKPLGPRRLARLQRELAERSRELEELGAQPAGPELLEKQRRFAELAARAAAANAAAGSAGAGAAIGAPGPSEPETPDHGAPEPEPVVLEPGPSEPVERITVVFPDPGGPDGAEGPVHDPVHVDPALFSNRLSPEELSALTHIEILSPGAPAQQEPHGEAAPGPPVAEAPAPSPSAGPEDEPAPPAPPVPATRAGGLELLEPGEYRSGTRWPALALALAVVLATALVVLLVLLVL